jgi:lauroyl/myristoyl acyltransferase
MMRESMRQIEIQDTSLVKLRPCRFVQETPDRFGIIRRAGMSRVVVRRIGIEACERFRKGCTIQEAKAQLAGLHQVNEDAVDLRPLLQSLQRADLIASVDGKPLEEACPPSLYSAYRYYLRFHWKQRLLRLAYQNLPTSIGKRVACATYRLDLSAILQPKARRAEDHVRNCSRAAVPVSMRSGFAGRYMGHLIRNIVDFESLQAMTPVRAEAWLDRHVQYEGLEHLAQAKSEGLPVIVAGFHFSATKLLALLLMRRGFDLAQVWMPDASVDLGSVLKRIEELNRDLPHYGKLEIIPDFTLPSYRRLLKSLSGGGTLVWFADMFGSTEAAGGKASPAPEWRDSASRIFDFALIRSNLDQSKIDVNLCGQRVYVNPWIGGFARTAGAVVLPAALIREGKGMRMMLWPALRLPPRATAAEVDALNRTMFERLDAQLRVHADQWFGWHSLCPVPAAVA